MSRTQSARKHLAIPARQLALKPRVQILRRSRRPLLRGMEQARRSALAHHVPRTAPMSTPVLINGTWYKFAENHRYCCGWPLAEGFQPPGRDPSESRKRSAEAEHMHALDVPGHGDEAPLAADAIEPTQQELAESHH